MSRLAAGGPLVTLLAGAGRLGGAELEVEGAAFRHLFRARRLPAGAMLRLVDGEGMARWGEVLTVTSTSARVALGAEAPANEPARELQLCVATLRAERAAWLVEKATELGVRAIRFLHTARAPRGLGSPAAARLRRVAAAALEQCHGARLPQLSGPHELRDLAALTGGLAQRWLLDTAAPREGLHPAAGWSSAALLVGPEGGWAEQEREALAAEGWAAVGLGPRVLRIESAALAGAALLLLAAPPHSGQPAP